MQLAVEQLDVAIIPRARLDDRDVPREGGQLPKPASLASYSGQFRLRVPRSLHASLAGAGEADGASLNTYVVSQLAMGVSKAKRQKNAAG